MRDQLEKYQNISIFVILSDKKCKHTIQKTYVGNYFNLVEYVKNVIFFTQMREKTRLLARVFLHRVEIRFFYIV